MPISDFSNPAGYRDVTMLDRRLRRVFREEGRKGARRVRRQRIADKRAYLDQR